MINIKGRCIIPGVFTWSDDDDGGGGRDCGGGGDGHDDGDFIDDDTIMFNTAMTAYAGVIMIMKEY